MLFGKKARSIRRILIVEDEALIAFDNEHLLRDRGYDVVATVDGVADALRAIDQSRPDLVMADVRLSDGGNGVDVARSASERDIPVLFVTGHCPIDARRYAIGCLAKPYSQRDLVAAIEAVDARLSGKRGGRVPAGLTFYDGSAAT